MKDIYLSSEHAGHQIISHKTLGQLIWWLQMAIVIDLSTESSSQ